MEERLFSAQGQRFAGSDPSWRGGGVRPFQWVHPTLYRVRVLRVCPAAELSSAHCGVVLVCVSACL